MDQETVYHRRWTILGVLVVSLLIVVLDNTILNVALKTIQQDLDATNSELIWAVNSYILVFASLLFTWGVLGDRYGRKRILVIGLVLFGLASTLCAFSGSPEQLIIFRGLMGVGGAAVMPVTLAIITNVFPPAERGRAIGTWAGAVGVAVAIGPITGGLLLEHFWWGSVFLINVPVVIVGLIGILWVVPESRGGRASRIDPVGVLMTVGGLLMLVYGIVHGGDTQDWTSPTVWGWIAAGLAVLATFVWFEARSDHPSLDIHLFSNREFTATLAAVTAAFFGLMGATFFLVFYLQLVREMSPLQAGVALLPLAVGQFIAATRSAHTAERLGPRVVISAGLTVVSLVFVSMVMVDVDTPMWWIYVLFFLIGSGMGSAIAPATTVMMSTLPLERAGAGSAVQNTVRQVGGALGVAISGTVLATVYGNQLTSAAHGLPADALAQASDSIGATYEVVGKALAGGLIDPAAAAKALAVADASYVTAMHVACLFTAAAALIGAAVAFTFLPRKAEAARIAAERHAAFDQEVSDAAGRAAPE